MPFGEAHDLFEIHIQDCATIDEALALQDPIARLLCPNPDHNGPCAIPWGFSLRPGRPTPTGAETTTLVLGVLTTASQANAVAAQIRPLVPHPTITTDADATQWETLVRQYELEA